MDFATAKQFMETVRVGHLATTDGQRPALRPMGAWAWVDGQLWIATGASDAKMADIKGHPAVEFCIADAKGEHLRLEATARVSLERADRVKLLAVIPWVAKYFTGPDNPEFAILRLTVTRLRAWNGQTMGYEPVPLA